MRSRTAATVAANWPAPPSARSSRVTLVTTTWRRPSRAGRLGDAPRLVGVDGAGPPPRGVARRLATRDRRQNRQARVHVSPRMRKVAVPEAKHSPLLGQRASSQTVCSSSSSSRAPVARYCRGAGALTLQPRRLAPAGGAPVIGSGRVAHGLTACACRARARPARPRRSPRRAWGGRGWWPPRRPA